MALAELTVVPKTAQDISNWAFSHQANHLDIIRRIYETTTPIPPATTATADQLESIPA